MWRQTEYMTHSAACELLITAVVPTEQWIIYLLTTSWWYISVRSSSLWEKMNVLIIWNKLNYATELNIFNWTPEPPSHFALVPWNLSVFSPYGWDTRAEPTSFDQRVHSSDSFPYRTLRFRQRSDESWFVQIAKSLRCCFFFSSKQLTVDFPTCKVYKNHPVTKEPWKCLLTWSNKAPLTLVHCLSDACFTMESCWNRAFSIQCHACIEPISSAQA